MRMRLFFALAQPENGWKKERDRERATFEGCIQRFLKVTIKV